MRGHRKGWGEAETVEGLNRDGQRKREIAADISKGKMTSSLSFLLNLNVYLHNYRTNVYEDHKRYNVDIDIKILSLEKTRPINLLL